jgi:imidazolonepropionase
MEARVHPQPAARPKESTMPHEQLWMDVNLATMVPGTTPYWALEDAAIAVDEGRITWLGPRDALPAAPEDFADTG